MLIKSKQFAHNKIKIYFYDMQYQLKRANLREVQTLNFLIAESLCIIRILVYKM